MNLENVDDLNKGIKISDPDLIFHLAAESHVDRSIDTPKPFIKNNIIGTLNLLESTNNHYQSLSDIRKKVFSFN